MPGLRQELAAAGLPQDDEACVLHAMFPREFAALHRPGPGPASPASTGSAPTRSGASMTPADNGAGRMMRLVLTVNGRRSEATVTDLN